MENCQMEKTPTTACGCREEEYENQLQCAYCEKETSIICKECNVPFCNDISGKCSHVIYHMVRSKHKTISIDGRTIKCMECGEENLFRLGRVEDSADLCNQIESLNLGHGSIQLGGIYCGTCKDLPRITKEKRISFYPFEVSEFEMKDLKETSYTPKIRQYFDPKGYLDTFIPLIMAERDKEREIKEKMKQENISVMFDNGYCHFPSQKNNGEFKVSVGDEVRFTAKYFKPSSNQTQVVKFKGYVCEEQFTDIVKVKLKDYVPTEVIGSYTVEFVWNDTTYKRMLSALTRIYSDKSKNLIFKSILKGTKETMKEIEVLQPNSFCTLNDSQKIAIRAALTRTLTLIQGPPGTGKTVVSAAIVYNLVKQFGKKVLVVAPSNTAADQLAIKINNAGIRVVRIMSRRREDVSSEVDFLCLHRMVKELDENRKKSTTKKILEMAEVVCCTCVSAGSSELEMANVAFPFVLIDEAVQATEPLCLIPCVYSPEKLILVGDHKQLGPTILNKEVVKHGFKISLFERLLKIGVLPYLLSVQYRMHPSLCAFPSEYFYNGLLQSGTSGEKVLDLPNNFFYACDGREEVSQSKTSFINKSEAAMVESIIRFLFKKGVNEHQIGVITPYEGQRSYILGQIFGNQPGNIEIKNVDGFQGREKDFIIVSLVRSSMYQGVGFVGDRRRINVTLTRAKHGLIIIGNPLTLYKNQIWADLLNWYDRNGMIFEGALAALKPLTLKSLNLRDNEES